MHRDQATAIRRSSISGCIEQLLAGRAVDDASAIEDDRFARERKREACVLLDDDDRELLRSDELRDHLHQVLHDDRRQAFHRLVEKEQLGIGHERAGNREHLLLAAGKLTAQIEPAFLELRKMSIGACNVPWTRARDDA